MDKMGLGVRLRERWALLGMLRDLPMPCRTTGLFSRPSPTPRCLPTRGGPSPLTC